MALTLRKLCPLFTMFSCVLQKYKYKAQLLMVFAYISITHSGLSQTCHNTRCPNILTFRSFANILSATTAAQQIKETAQWNIIDPA